MIELQGVLRGIDLTVGRGEILGVTGRSGAGKSALLRTINLLDRPIAGKVFVNGLELSVLSARRLRDARRQIGVLFQDARLLSSRTVYGNVALPLELDGARPFYIKQRVDALLDRVGLSALAGRYPEQINGSEQQRVGIARALATLPRLLLLDDPVSALDPGATRSVLALLRQVNRDFGMTIVLATRQMQVIRQIADRVAVLDGGRIVEQGAVVDAISLPHEGVPLADLRTQEISYV